MSAVPHTIPVRLVSTGGSFNVRAWWFPEADLAPVLAALARSQAGARLHALSTGWLLHPVSTAAPERALPCGELCPGVLAPLHASVEPALDAGDWVALKGRFNLVFWHPAAGPQAVGEALAPSALIALPALAPADWSHAVAAPEPTPPLRALGLSRKQALADLFGEEAKAIGSENALLVEKPASGFGLVREGVGKVGGGLLLLGLVPFALGAKLLGKLRPAGIPARTASTATASKGRGWIALAVFFGVIIFVLWSLGFFSEAPIGSSPPPSTPPATPKAESSSPFPVFFLIFLFWLFVSIMRNRSQASAPQPPARPAPAAAPAISSRGARPAWLLRLLGRVPASLGGNLESWREAKAQELADLFRTNPELALRRAIPLGGPHLNRGRATKGFGLNNFNAIFNLAGLGGGQAVDEWDLAPSTQHLLRQRYEEAAKTAEKEGRLERAAFIQAQLLGNHREAARILEAAGRHREAATLFRDFLNEPKNAAACLARGGHLSEAAEAHLALGDWLAAGDLFQTMGLRERALAAYQEAVRTCPDRLQRAELIRNRLRDKEAALAEISAGWPHGPQAQVCLRRHLEWQREDDPDSLPATLERLATAAGRPHPPTAVAETLVWLSAQNLPEEVRQRTNDLAWEVCAEGLAHPNRGETVTLGRLLSQLRPADRLLPRDTTRWISSANRREKPQVPSPKNGLKPEATLRLPTLNGRWLDLIAGGDILYALGWDKQTPDDKKQLVLIRFDFKGLWQELRWDYPYAPGARLLWNPFQKEMWITGDTHREEPLGLNFPAIGSYQAVKVCLAHSAQGKEHNPWTQACDHQGNFAWVVEMPKPDDKPSRGRGFRVLLSDSKAPPREMARLWSESGMLPSIALHGGKLYAGIDDKIHCLSPDIDSNTSISEIGHDVNLLVPNRDRMATAFLIGGPVGITLFLPQGQGSPQLVWTFINPFDEFDEDDLRLYPVMAFSGNNRRFLIWESAERHQVFEFAPKVKAGPQLQISSTEPVVAIASPDYLPRFVLLFADGLIEAFDAV